MAVGSGLNQDEQNRVAVMRSSIRDSRESAAGALDAFRRRNAALEISSGIVMPDENPNGNKARSDINRIRELIRSGTQVAGIPAQQGVDMNENGPPSQFRKGKGQDNQIT